MDNIRGGIGRHYGVIKPVFQFYSTLPAQSPGLGTTEWQKFLMDLRGLLQHKTFLKGAADTIWARVSVREKEEQASKAPEELNPQSFAEALLWLAHTRYAGERNGPKVCYGPRVGFWGCLLAWPVPEEIEGPRGRRGGKSGN